MTIYETLKSKKMTEDELEELFYKQLDEAINKIEQEKEMRLESARDNLVDAIIYYLEVLQGRTCSLSFESLAERIKRTFE